MFIEGRDLLKDYDAIRRELERYRPELLDRPEILVLNKSDLIHDEALVEPLIARLAERDLDPLCISAAASQGLDELLIEMLDAVEAARRDDEKKEA